jgi:cobyrinic acid a,c-diamide synthase
MAALTARGLTVSGHKVGPDYIDPGYHAMATGRPGRNLDPFMVGEDRIVPLLLHGAAAADVAVIEGVMGLFDGRLGTDGEASTAHVAGLTSSPVILVVDISHASRTHAAVVAGLASFDPAVRIAGVILNKARTTRHADEVRAALTRTGIPVLGVLPRDSGVETPSRHLGLVPAAERAESASTVFRLAGIIEEHIDLDAVLLIAQGAPTLEAAAWDPAAEVAATSATRPVVAIAGGRAFTFRYAETEELLRAAGCDVVEFDPLTDTALPTGTAGIYLGGGFPEVHATDLAGNAALIAELHDAISAGVPTVAECAGLAYLCRTLDDTPSISVVAAAAAMTPRLTLGYRTAVSPSDSLLGRAGEQVTGHEFHRTRVTPPAGTDETVSAAWELPTAEGFATPSLHASYLHVHWAGHPHLAQRFADAAHEYDTSGPKVWARAATSDLPTPAATPTEPLRHHGDAEVRSGLLDFAVNVYAGPRPAWLDDALHDALEHTSAYPDAHPARVALAARHSRAVEEVLPTAGAAEAFSLVADLRRWRRPVVIHPQFTEPQVALEAAGHTVTTVLCRPEDGFVFDPDTVPADADLVVVGNPTNPTAVLHPAETVRRLLRPGRVVLVDEAFLDAIPGEPESLSCDRSSGLLVTRSLTKQWSIPGIRAGYLLGDPALIAAAAARQTRWSVSTPAIAAMLVCSQERALAESRRRAEQLASWRTHLAAELTGRDITVVAGSAPFVLAQVGRGIHHAMRDNGIAVRRADTFPGLDDTWIRIACRDAATTERLLEALDQVLPHIPCRRIS